jgi:hypothetical protein
LKRDKSNGQGPVGDIVRAVFLEIINNPDEFCYDGNENDRNKFDDLKKDILSNAGNIDKLVSSTTDGVCYIASLWFLSVASGNYNGGLQDFMLEGYMRGDFGQKRDGNYAYDWVNKPDNYYSNSFSGEFNLGNVDTILGNSSFAIARIGKRLINPTPEIFNNLRINSIWHNKLNFIITFTGRKSFKKIPHIPVRLKTVSFSSFNNAVYTGTRLSTTRAS